MLPAKAITASQTTELVSVGHVTVRPQMKEAQMKSQLAFACFAVLFAQDVVSGFFSQDTEKTAKSAAFSLADVKYFHRFTKDDQREYTPEGQEDLKAWTDMTTLHYYRKAKDGEALAATANAVLENYKKNGAKVVRTDSVPSTKEKPAEHLIVVIFGRPEFLEVVFARFRMHDGVGTAVIYSHRVYGNKVGNEMSAWLEKNGPDTEKNLLKWDSMPKPPAPK